MDEKKERIELKWYHIRRVRFTGEYLGGAIGGFGLGITTWIWVLSFDIIHPYLPMIGTSGFALIWLGSSIALHAQDRYVTH